MKPRGQGEQRSVTDKNINITTKATWRAMIGVWITRLNMEEKTIPCRCGSLFVVWWVWLAVWQRSCQIWHWAQVPCGADAGALVAFNKVLEPLNSMVTEARFTWVSSVLKINGKHDEWQYTPTRCMCQGVKKCQHRLIPHQSVAVYRACTIVRMRMQTLQHAGINIPCISANMYLHAELSTTKWLKAMIDADRLSNRLCIPRVPENFKTADEARLGSTR